MQAVGSQVVLKFHYGKRNSVNPIISKTLGRVAVIGHGYMGPMPQAGSFWLCRIERELKSSKSETGGCFVVVPLQEVSLDKIVKLVPGAYEAQPVDNTLFCIPNVSNFFWIAPFSIKKFYLNKDKAKVQYQSVIVPLTFTNS
jgi:hypothetical protein